jgi:uncharacterized protein GlcG (DUF336 family)
MSVTLAQANTIANAALKKGREHKFAPLTIVVLDGGGHVVVCQREDGSGIVRFDLAYGKAWCSLGMGFGTRELTERAAKAPAFVNALMAASQGRAVPSPGGVLIRDAAGIVIGSVGISGDTGDNDEICAVAGIEAAGLKAQVGAAK